MRTPAVVAEGQMQKHHFLLRDLQDERIRRPNFLPQIEKSGTFSRNDLIGKAIYVLVDGIRLRSVKGPLVSVLNYWVTLYY
jgi:hypothetical protein